MAKKVYKFANDPEGWRGRLALAAERTRKVLNSRLARDQCIERLGMQIGVNFEYHPEGGSRFSGMHLKRLFADEGVEADGAAVSG